MSSLADAVLPLIRTRAEVYRWGVANNHGSQMHDAIDLLEAAIPTTAPADAYKVVNAALASAIKVIARADDSSGIIGDACRRLLELHPQVAAAAKVAPGKLVDWMMKFQFDGDVDYFDIDPVAYAPALGDVGMKAYRKRVAEMRASLGPEVPASEYWSAPHQHERWLLDRIDQRLAVFDRDVDAIIRTHVRDRRVAAWFQDAAEALAEIGEFDLAIDWARQASEHDSGHQSLKAGDYWCQLLAEHRPAEYLAARVEVFRRWPSASTAAALHKAAGSAWGDFEEEVTARLAARPRDAVLFSLLTLKDTRRAWEQAHALDLPDDDVWVELIKVYERTDPLAVLPVHRRLVEHQLVQADATNYRKAAKRLATMRKLAAGTEQAVEVDAFVAALRETQRRRPRLQQEFDRARLP
jgi:hypothetical protein